MSNVFDPGLTGTREYARAQVEVALGLDRNSTRVLQRAEAQMADAQSALDACIVGAPATDVTAAANSLQVAIGALRFSTEYQTSARATLAASLDDLTNCRPLRSPAPEPDRPGLGSVEAVLLAEATAIAAAAQAHVAEEMHADALLAATTAHDAALAAAVTVAEAANDARRARELADTLAAEDVASAAANAASDVQRRAEELAAIVLAAASLAVAQLPTPHNAEATLAADRLAALVVSTAASKARETAAAAATVAEAVARAASDVASAAATIAVSTEHDVRRTARAVQATARITADELATASAQRAPSQTVGTETKS